METYQVTLRKRVYDGTVDPTRETLYWRSEIIPFPPFIGLTINGDSVTDVELSNGAIICWTKPYRVGGNPDQLLGWSPQR